MKAIKITALTLAMLSGTAMANVVTDTTDSVVGGAKTLFKTATNPAAVSLELGTQGYGANVAWGINESTELQAGWAGMDFDVSAEIGGDDSIINWKKVLGEEYERFSGELQFKAKTSNPYLGVQMRPFSNWVTVGAGVIVPKHEFSAGLTATTDTSISVNGKDYDVNGTGAVNITAENHNKLAPYATLGFRPNINNRFGLFAEVGAAYVGNYKTSVAVTGDVPEKEELQRELEKEVSDSSIPVYPIAKAGITYRF